jgi:hypothetical protein
MGKLDALSRQANHGSGQGDNDNLTLLAPELFRIHALAGVRLKGDERNILREVQCSLKVDDDNLNTTQTPECTKEKYNVKIKMKGSLLRSHQQPT